MLRRLRTLDVAAAVLLACLVVDALLLGAHLLNRLTLQSRLFDFDVESNLPTWWSTVQFMAAAVLAAIAAKLAGRSRARLAWAGVGLLTLAMSIDETASLHEEAGSRLGATTTLSLTQPIAALAVAALLVLASLPQAPRPRLALRLAAGMLLVSQACASFAGLYLSGRGRFLLESVEDIAESITAGLLVYAALTFLAAWWPRT